MSRLNKLNKRGFTLVEILVVILIIGILFVAFLPKIDFAGDKARETGVKASLRSYMVASEQLLRENAGFKSDGVNDTNPTTKKNAIAANVVELNKLLDASSRITTTDGTTNGAIFAGAVKTNELDPWKKEYEIYFHQGTGTERKIVVASYGKNQTAGTADFVLVTTYKDGVIKSCTTGLNVNIGKMTGTIATDGRVLSTNYGTLGCQ